MLGPGFRLGSKRVWPLGDQNNLSDEQIIRLDKERQAFFEDTRDLRDNLYQKDLELRSELAKKDPDVKRPPDCRRKFLNLLPSWTKKGSIIVSRCKRIIRNILPAEVTEWAAEAWDADSTVRAWAGGLAARAAVVGIRFGILIIH